MPEGTESWAEGEPFKHYAARFSRVRSRCYLRLIFFAAVLTLLPAVVLLIVQ